MSLDKHYQQEPTREEVDACLDELENEVSLDQALTQSRQTRRLTQGPRANPGGLLWLLLVLGIAFLAWLVSMLRF